MSSIPSVVREEDQDRGRYVLRVDRLEAEMTYRRVAPGIMRIEHTAVPDALSGQGIGKRLIEAALADARYEGHRIEPVCPYVASQFRRHPEWADVLADYRPPSPLLLNPDS